MNKLVIAFVFSVALFVSGCSSINHSVPNTASQEVIVWWGTKAEIKTFLDSPEAKSDRWIIQSIK